jgi:hypothetical protein
MRRIGKLQIIIIAFILLLVSLPLACTPAQTTTSTPPPTSPPPSATNSTVVGTPSQQDTAPAVPAQTPVEKPTSFEAVTYTNDSIGFSVKYPKNWTLNDNRGTQVLYESANNRPAEDMLWVHVLPATADMTVIVRGLLDKAYAISTTVVSNKLVTLSDGKTEAREIILAGVLQTTSQSGRYICCLGTIHNGKTILVIASTASINGNNSLIEEIAHTLTVK